MYTIRSLFLINFLLLFADPIKVIILEITADFANKLVRWLFVFQTFQKTHITCFIGSKTLVYLLVF